jgi:MFS family permease
MRHRRSISFIVASFVSFCGYTSLFFIRDPVRNAGAIYPLLCVIGLGEIGMIVTSLSLVTSDAYVSPDIRGSVAGCYSLFGGLGLLILTRVGGALTEVWVDSAPFFVVGVLAGLICLIGFVVELVSTKRRVTLSANLMDAADAAE